MESILDQRSGGPTLISMRSIVMAKFPEGYQEPFHSHTANYHAVLIQGEFRSLNSDRVAEPEKVLGPGSHIFQPGGENHAELNAGSGESLALVFLEGPVDFVPAE